MRRDSTNSDAPAHRNRRSANACVGSGRVQEATTGHLRSAYWLTGADVHRTVLAARTGIFHTPVLRNGFL